MFKYNMDQEKRDSFLKVRKLYGYDRDHFGFYDLEVETLKILLDEKFADPKERQNDSPTIQKFYEFMVQYPEFKAHGYAVGGERTDYRITIEGLRGIPSNYDARDAFYRMFKKADEFDDNYPPEYMRCWYD